MHLFEKAVKSKLWNSLLLTNIFRCPGLNYTNLDFLHTKSEIISIIAEKKMWVSKCLFHIALQIICICAYIYMHISHLYV